MHCCAVIVAAGRGQRFGAPRPKQFLFLHGRPLLCWTVEAFERCASIASIVVVVAPDEVQSTEALFGRRASEKPLRLCAGGAERVDSVRSGVEHAPAEATLIAIHDGARPLPSADLISRVVDAAAHAGAALPTLPVRETVKRVEQDLVRQTIDRRTLHLAQTPQVFSRVLIERALHEARSMTELPTDDVQLVERIGATVQAVAGEVTNIKVTVPEDLAQASRILEQRGVPRRWPRVGTGYDVHPLAPAEGAPFVLGGVRIPFAQRLVGHSDADVLAHAVGDALLGALSLGDLGQHFPPGDERFRGADSLKLLEQIARLVGAAGYALGNLDVMLIAEAPKIAPHVPAMREALARALGAQPEQISVKATTNEKLGFVGRQEGIAAMATVLVVPVDG